MAGNDAAATGAPAVDERIDSLPEWQALALTRVRKLIRQADPDVVEDVKWRKPSNPLGVAVWEHDGLICTGESYKDKVKVTFAKGAALEDPAGVFNASLDAGTRRAIDLREGDELDEAGFIAVVRAAVALNEGRTSATSQER